MAGDVEFVFASRNERSLKQTEIKPLNNYGEEDPSVMFFRPFVKLLQ